VDHGGSDLFYLDKPRGEWLNPAELDGWLEQLESAVPGVKINVIIEACLSGSFINLAQNISKAGRVVISSTDAVGNAYASPNGAVFSDAFLSALEQNLSLKSAFDEGVGVTRQAWRAQYPWLDDNGDGLPNGPQDGLEAQQRGFAQAGTLGEDPWSPYIAQTKSANLSGIQGEIWAEVRDDEQVRWVYAVVFPPSYQAPLPGEEWAVEPLPITLQDRGNGWYGGLYTSFNEIGIYRVVIYAEDNDGLVSSREMLAGWKAFLPVMVASSSARTDQPLSLHPLRGR
jgi:hypothetical protein